MAKNFKLEFTQVSALSADNIGKAFDILARKVLKRISNTPQPVNRVPQKLETNQKKNAANGCC